MEFIKLLFKKLFCKEHTFKKYKYISNNFTFLGTKYSDCIYCGKKRNELNKEQQKKSKYIDSGISI